MDSTKQGANLPSQRCRTLRDRHEESIVPGFFGSSSYDGLTGDCTARSPAELAIAKKQAKEAMRAGLPVVRLPRMETGMPKEGRTDQGSETDYMSVPAGPSRGAGRGEEGKRLPPGPASFKVKYNTRSRSGSASSVSSVSSSASIAVVAERRSRREAAQEANRLAMQVERNQEGGSPPILVDSDESDEESHSKEKRHPPRKRKLPEGSDEEMEEDSKRKAGRPQTTGLYIGRAKALEKLNQNKREAAELDNEKLIRSLSSGQIFAKMERDLEDAVDELSYAPTADIASQARECMAGVLKVSKCSRNLKGTMRKILNHAAVKGAASTEVLRTRADSSGSDNEAARQLKELKKELEQIRREAQNAKEEATRANKEAERLREELAEMRAERESRRRGRAFVEDSSPSPLLSPNRGQAVSNAGQVEPAEAPAMQAEESPMEVEIAAEEAVQEEPLKYCDERRRKEILPPPEEWPAAIRPALQGKVKILEDRPLIGHKVRLVDGKMKKKKVEPSPAAGVAEEEKGGAQLLLEQITPLLQKWLEENLKSIGFSKKPSGRDAVATNAKRQPSVGPKTSQKAEKPTRPQTKGPEGPGRKWFSPRPYQIRPYGVRS